MSRVWERELHTLEGPVDRLAAEITAAAAGDKDAESQSKKRGCLSFLLLAIALACFFAGAGRKGKFKHRDRPFVFAAAILGICGVASGVAAYRASRRDVDEVKLAEALGLLRVISLDSPKDAPARLSLDLRPYESLKPAGQSGEGRTFVQGWLALEGQLADGNKYRLSVVEKIRRKEKSKRKWTKVRESTRSQIRISLRLRPDYGPGEEIAPRLKKAAPPPPLVAGDVRALGRVITTTLALPPVQRANGRYAPLEGPQPHATSQHMLGALLWAYSGLGRGA